MGVCMCIYIHSCSGTCFPILITRSKSKLGRNWQRVGAACQALQTREVVKHKHFGVYPQDLCSLAAEGQTCVEGGCSLPPGHAAPTAPSPAPRQPHFHSRQRASERAARGCPSLPSLSTGRAGWVLDEQVRVPLPCTKVKADLLDA